MNAKAIKQPGPDHPMTIETSTEHVLVTVAGQTIADTYGSLLLREAKYPPIFYIPRVDANMALLARSEHTTYCPYKGECSYFSIPIGGEKGLNAVWTYEDPYPAAWDIKDYLAFYSDRVDLVSEPSNGTKIE